MIFSSIIHIALLCTAVAQYDIYKIKQEAIDEYEEYCNNLTSNPVFMEGFVVNKVWVVYYSWNVKLDAECAEVTFKKANDLIVKRYWKEIKEYLKEQPHWGEAALVVTLDKFRQMLLFNMPSGIAGQYTAVPSRQGFEGTPGPEKLPLFKIYMKLFHRGRYIIMSDCLYGVTLLAVNRYRRPKRADIDSFAANFNFGDGYPACTEELDPLIRRNGKYGKAEVE